MYKRINQEFIYLPVDHFRVFISSPAVLQCPARCDRHVISRRRGAGLAVTGQSKRTLDARGAAFTAHGEKATRGLKCRNRPVRVVPPL